MTGVAPLATVTVRGADGRPAGTVAVGADGTVSVTVDDPAEAARVHRVAEHLARPRRARPRPSCVPSGRRDPAG